MNGSGGWVPIRVGLNDINAYYDGTQVQIGKNQAGQWISALDVVGPRVRPRRRRPAPPAASPAAAPRSSSATSSATLTEYYDNQSASYDGPDWTVGEEVNLVGQGPIRDMANPAAVGDPVCYTSAIPTTEVHAAAGPGNHWFYLLSQGGTSRCDGTSVTGIGDPERRQDHVQRDADEDLVVVLPQVPHLDAAGGQEPGQHAAPSSTRSRTPGTRSTCRPRRPTRPAVAPRPPPTGGNILLNPGFESGAASWAGTTGLITTNTGRPARTGSYKAWFGGNGATSTENLTQTVTVPATATAANLSYWIRTDTAESGSTVYDTLKVQVVVGGVTTTLRTFSNVGTSATYTQFSAQPARLQGQGRDGEVPDERGLVAPDELRRRRHRGLRVLDRPPGRPYSCCSHASKASKLYGRPRKSATRSAASWLPPGSSTQSR